MDTNGLTDEEKRALAKFVVGASRAKEPFGWDARSRELFATVESIIASRLDVEEEDDEPASECSECDTPGAKVVEHGMCESCLHDAYRSGWQPGSED